LGLRVERKEDQGGEPSPFNTGAFSQEKDTGERRVGGGRRATLHRPCLVIVDSREGGPGPKPARKKKGGKSWHLLGLGIAGLNVIIGADMYFRNGPITTKT